MSTIRAMVDTPHPNTDAVAERLQEALGSAFRLERELGGGGMSRVFVARDAALDRRVVVKVLPETIAEGLSADRFRREIMLSAGLQHPNIVPVIAAGDAGGLPYFVMPFVEGESLRGRIARGPLMIPEVVSILRDVARALGYAHARGIIHRDIKPDNILLSGGAAVVADFGVAKALVESAPGTTSGDSARTLTRVGMSLGTPAYMAPEQVVADPAMDQRVDIYSLGVLAFEALAGRAPFTGETVAEVMSAHLTRTPEPLTTVRPGTPIALGALVARCMEKDPRQRPANAEQLLQLLDDPAVVSGAVPSLASVPAVARGASHGRSRTLALIGAALLAVAGGGWWVLRGRTGGTAAVQTIAVLPLDQVTSDTADAYLAQGIADEVLNALARIPGVHVASRLAAKSVATAKAPAEVAKQLGVTMTLEGSVQRRGDRVRVTAQLARVIDGVSVWSETYDRPGSELYALQGEIAGSVAATVRADVARDRDVSKAATHDPAAYDDYLRGHYLLAHRGASSIREAITRFERAIDRDSTFARAYAELAQAYAVLPLYTGGGSELLGSAERAARRAIALDSSLAPAHAALGYLQDAAWKWSDGRASLRRAVALDSSDATAWQWLGENLLITGDARGARDAFAAASRMDSEALIATALQAVASSLGGDHETGVQLGRRVVDANPSQAVPRFMLGTVLVYAGRYGEAVSELREAQRLAPSVLAVNGTLGHALARGGDAAAARGVLAALRRTPDAPGVQPAIAKVLVALGDADGAMTALERAATAHDGFFASEPLLSPLFAPLQSHARWPALLASLGIVPVATKR
ncbi:MAG: protein kinase [Gemmatimonadaceae bacterium]